MVKRSTSNYVEHAEILGSIPSRSIFLTLVPIGFKNDRRDTGQVEGMKVPNLQTPQKR